MFPLTHRASVTVPYRDGARVDRVPQVLSSELEALGYSVTEQSEAAVAFAGPNPGRVVRFPGSWLDQLSGGRIAVRAARRLLVLHVELSFQHYALLIVLLTLLFGVMMAVGTSVSPWVIAAIWPFYCWLFLAIAAITTSKRFAKRLRLHLEKEPFFGA
jgi:hypothetical protein